MKRMLSLVCSAALLGLVLGCGTKSTETTKPVAEDSHAGHSHDDGHDHADGHTHGPAPHGGTLVDWGGGKYHVEFVVDHAKQEATVYILGEDAQTPLPIAAEKVTVALDDPSAEVELIAQPLDGEAAGSASRFVGVHDAFGEAKEFSGAISGEIDETPYVGEFKESAAAQAP